MPPRICLGSCAALLFLSSLFAATPLPAQAPERTITIPRAEQPPELEDFITDGRLDPALDEGRAASDESPVGAVMAGDPRGIRVSGFRQREPNDGGLASQPTAAYLSYDDANLYVVFVCHDDPAGVRANVARREDIGDDDQVVVYLDTFHSRQRAYQFAANPLGVQLDGIRSEATGNVDLSFDQVWSSEGRLVADGYVVRLAIPFRSLRFRPGAEQLWGIALSRIIERANERSHWPHVTRRVQGYVSQFGSMNGLAQISPGRNIQATPYAMAARARVFDDEIPDHVTQGDERIGLDAKMVLRDALTLDATVNPDFSQVESDDPQVTVNERFEVFFPERRPFFLENSDYFQTPEQLFFSRRIVDPGVGLRTTGKVGGWAVGALAMNDRAPALEPDDPAAGADAWIGAARVERELGEESAIGFLVTDREFVESQKFDRMFAADARVRIGDNWELSGQAMRSQTGEHDRSRYADWGLRADVSYSSRAWESSAGYREFGPDFNAPLGFVNRAGFRRVDFDGQYTFWPESELVREFGPTLSISWLWDHTSRVLQDRVLEAAFAVELVRSTEIEISHVQAYELFEGFGFDLHANQVQLQTEWFKWLGAELSFARGTEVNHEPAEGLEPERGRATEAEIGLTLRPTKQLRIQGSYLHASLHTDPGSELLFTEDRLRTKLNYQFSRLLSLRAIVDVSWEDFNTERVEADDPRERKWGLDLLLTYLVHPGTALYLGVTDERENLATEGSPPEVVRSRNPSLSVGRQVFLKASYLVRF